MSGFPASRSISVPPGGTAERGSIRSQCRNLALVAAMLALAPAVPAAAQDDFGGLPAGPGQEEVFYNCSACHSMAIVMQQGLPRDRWEYLLEWMVDEQGMAPLEPDDHAAILEYLVQHYGTDGG